MGTRVLRLPRQDNPSFVLVNVAPTTGSSRPLDVTLIGTEGVAPYVLKLKQNRLLSLKAKADLCDDDDWQTILESVLLRNIPDEAVELLRGVEAVAAVDEEQAINIIIRKRIEGITQKLGSLQLTHDENQEIELFHWCTVAIESTSTSTKELTSLKSKYQEQEDTITKLKAQLEQLTKVKIHHEAELIEKFRLLLNEKKSKIRDQSRLLAFSNVDSRKLAELEASRRGRSSAKSRKGKRKEAGSDTDDSAFEKMDVGEGKPSGDSDAREEVTPGPSEDEETADEDETSVAAAPTRNIQKGAARIAKTAKQFVPQEDADMEDTPPPVRELPFGKKPATAQKVYPPTKPSAGDDGEKTESDDEL